jgi:hypothetical protein
MRLTIENGIDQQLDAAVHEMRQIPRRFLGTPRQERLPLQKGVSLRDLTKGGFLSIDANGAIGPLNRESPFGGILLTIAQGPGDGLVAIVQTKGTVCALCQDIGALGDPIFLSNAEGDYRYIFTMRPSETGIPIGTLQAV